MRGVWAIVVCSILASGCTAEEGEAEAIASESAELLENMMRSVVAARMYHLGVWTLPQADTYKVTEYPDPVDRRVAYVCDAIGPLHPTYVSGLVRLDADQVVLPTEEQAVVFERVKQCIRQATPHPVKFDVVLNAEHYSDGKYGVHTANQGADKIRARLNSANDAFHPDAWFFDFYWKPWADDGEEHHPDAMKAGIRWIRNHHQLVGGNLFGTKVPDGSDFVSITDRGGMGVVENLMSQLRKQPVPVLMHIRNDPQVPHSEGLKWIQRDLAYRKSEMRAHVHGESLGYKYMFPVFFPLDEQHRAYDASQDGNMLERIREYLHGGGDASGKLAGDAEQDFVSSTADERIAIHRGFHGGSQQHLFSLSLMEIDQAPGVTLEVENFFYLGSPNGAANGNVPFYRCYLGSGWHLLTTVAGCEGWPGAIDEGSLGFIAPTQLADTVPLHRLFRAAAPDHFYTPSASERDVAVSLGYVDEGVVGYVWTTP